MWQYGIVCCCEGSGTGGPITVINQITYGGAMVVGADETQMKLEGERRTIEVVADETDLDMEHTP